MAITNKPYNPFVIFIDWGTTNYRAYKYHIKNNIVVAKIQTNKGILNVKGKSEYLRILNQTLNRFKLNKNTLFYVAGMVGSKKGLYEAPYVSVPTTIKNLASKITKRKYSNIKLNIVPGLVNKQNKFYDVIRGEETLVIGAINKLKLNGVTYLCCPGSHSKWLLVNNNNINHFSTYMSGELYNAISKSTILAQSIKNDSSKFSNIFFTKGLLLVKQGGSISNILFKIRTMDIFKQNNAYQRASFLSGIIIGAEISEISKQKNIIKSKVILIAGGPLTKLYSLSLNFFKIKFKLVQADSCFIIGMKKLYEVVNG